MLIAPKISSHSTTWKALIQIIKELEKQPKALNIRLRHFVRVQERMKTQFMVKASDDQAL